MDEEMEGTHAELDSFLPRAQGLEPPPGPATRG